MKLTYRTVWISDTHLGSRGCRAEDLSRFLKQVRCERLYLVGDIIDMQRLRQRWYWPATHNDVLRRILKHAKRGTEVLYIPGNHDDGARQYRGLEFGGVNLALQAIHETADGRKLWVCHGDQFDLVVRHSPMLSMLGEFAYEWLLVINRWYNGVRSKLGLPYASLSQAIKAKVKQACTFISRFEEVVSKETKRRELDGVVCGHIHKAEIGTLLDDIAYYNCGDWVESCTALVEHEDGRMQIIDGIKAVEQLKQQKQQQGVIEDDRFDEGDDADDVLETVLPGMGSELPFNSIGPDAPKRAKDLIEV